MNRRNFLGLLASALPIGACTSNNVSMRTISTAIDTSLGNASAFDPDYPDKLPYASIAVKLPGIAKALLVLGKVEGNELHWISADRSVLVTQHGRIIRTVGLAGNLAKTELSDQDFLQPGANITTLPTAATRVIDLLPGNRYGLKVTSTIERLGPESIEIGRRTYQTTKIAEHCVAAKNGWTFTNTYWLDINNIAWKSIQHVAPELAPINIEITKAFKNT